MAEMRYRQLDATQIIETARQIGERVRERFPHSGLGHVNDELILIAGECMDRCERIRQPYWLLRIAAGLGAGALLVLAAATVTTMHLSTTIDAVATLVQTIDAAVNDVVFLGIALYFLATLETRHKRHVALAGLHGFRSIAHIVDMHQLSKDSEQFVGPARRASAQAPKREMTQFELARYLDYCTQMLSLTSKLAALYVQHLDDPVVLNAVNDLEELAAGLSHKIWQKIMILDTVVPRIEPGRASTRPV